MMSKLILVISLLGLLSVCVGQYLQNGQCDPNIELTPNFDIERFLGTWYEIARSDNPSQNGDCAEFQLTNRTNTINVNYTTVDRNFYNEANGSVSQAVNGSARLTLTLASSPSPIDFWVLSTDYSTIAVAYSCRNVSTTQRSVHVWVLGRQRQYPNEMTSALVNTTLNNTFGINATSLRHVDHSANGCYRLPVIAPGRPIVLPGQCDPNIPVVQNFNVARFLGVWHEIASYETASSNGNCIRAQYSLGDGGVNVLNSQVINQALLTINGVATVNSTDNSARLSVLLDIPGMPPTPQLLWILASDYDNYAISYSCLNISATERRVFSWILSRTRQLPASSQAAINQTVNSILDLNYQYYQPTNQTDEGCFFYPQPVPNQPVVFGGQCASLNVQSMRNFNATRYMGLWHTIELYPAANNNGECSNAQYTLVDGSVNVINSHVINQTLYTARAVAYPVGVNGSAELIVQFPIPGSNQTINSDYWVLDTDYDNYALVYSCSNINADEMRVTSWKLSRTKQMSPASNVAINNAMNRTLVLRQQYYVPMNQSAQSCFYFPEPRPGVPVVFPGQCDNSISAVPNFNFTSFAGVWYLVQSYPNAQYTGQCVRHEYTFVNSSRLNLTLSSVSDQFLSAFNATLSGSTNDNSGRLTVSINGTSATNVPFWIINTDYTNHALAYACVNINQDFRAVWSWKLSRTQQLSAASNTAINNAMTNNVVLDNAYFEDIDQSARACFYLPDLSPGDAIILPGQCNASIAGVPNFNITRFAGRWRLIESYASAFQTGTCNVAEYTAQSNPNVLDVVNSQVVNLNLSTISGTANIMTVDGSGRLLFSFPGRGNFEYIVLDTDYDSYSLGYGCVNMDNNQRRVYSWKMSRNNTLTQAANNNINRIIDSIEVLNNRFYYIVNRTEAGCFYYPQPDPTSIVRFRTQCNLNIPVVNNFNTTRYLGLWHDIQSYPENFQSGTCNNAYYSPANNAVGVRNTQVIDQALRSISGTAVPAFTDGTGRLNVTFTRGGVNVTTNYWVMATDYDSYSFVYSCRPIDDEFVQILSWKLSRTRSLTPAANTAINNVMSTVPVLDQGYFLNRNQTREGCFYFPEPQADEPVVFPGQCDNNIAAVPDFNMGLFAGTWYEVERYPEARTPGQCVSHQYSLNGTNRLNLQRSDVLNLTLNSRPGNLILNSTDGSGRLLINATYSPMQVPFWVLATDYTNFALGYSCVNINSDYRAVWSWKLSRTRQLSVASNTAINNAMANVYVLNNRYFENVDQSDQACFYLPDITPGDQVDLPGQCDPNIRGMENFNLARFAGRWRLIESYGSRFQSGTCNIARYTLINSTTIGIVNQQVVNQSLSTISGSASVNGTGVLTFRVDDRDTLYDLYVLDTDYDSYALTYGCVNLPNNQRRVSSWKFSRSNTLSQTANNNINRIINSIDVLHQPYYYTVNRTEAACFYYPEVNSNVGVRFPGTCNQNIPVVTNFNVTRYLGLWHDVQSYPADFQSGTCNNAYYSPTNNAVGVFNTQVIDQTLRNISGTAVPAFTDGTARLNVTFNVGGFNVTTDYWVLATDYDSYSLVYSCRPIDDEYVQITSWKLSRTKSLTPAANTAINNVMNNIPVLDQRYFLNRNQTPEGCFYYPVPQAGVPVVFPGQCDNSIAAVPSFNMNLFQGTWYEIQSYPEQRTPGQCVNHQYALNGTNTLDLQTSDVLNETLNLRGGNVIFTSTDGSGRLLINVTGSSMEIPYWILRTDYTNFALAYSCVNINSDYRAVWSWKLSRTRQLSEAANAAMNTTISSIDVLDNMYYENVDQSDQACFYLPDLGPRDPVVFPGQCDPNIPVMQNFNASRYLGRWRLIETYYSEFQSGTCNAATYSAAANGSVIVFNENVVNEELRTISGYAVPASNDGSGRLIVTFPNRPAPVPYWVLDTDYDSYALIYTCVNTTSEQRRVWSWKMSRTNTLTANATARINQIVDSINVLNPRYYQVVNRTDAACFYYPTPDGSNVVFPGQCDQNIPAVRDFNATLYSGTWFDVESYPTNFQRGTCNTARYTLAPPALYAVQNTQVLDQVLRSTNGTAVAATNDGSARLNVTFNLSSGRVTTNYWVLATDYTTYSLVYSCRNIDDEFRAVYSWKLGRQTSLPQAAENAIQATMNTVPVLRQQYYMQRNHTAAACFYYPDNYGGDVILDGQCVPDAQVPAVANFNSNSFSGVWHEIARFPSELQNGECTNTQYSLAGGNAFSVVQTSVLNEALLNTTTQATIAANGRGAIRINAPGVPFNDVYILATDYNEYALAYSCRNLTGNRKQIFSWKLGRSRAGLSVAANNAINQVVSSNIDLFEGYYRNTSQDNAACFYYPVFDQLPPVIELPGPCNTTIRGIPNFNAPAYLGRWFEMARYPQRAQTGQCNRAVYGNLGGGLTSVVNSQVTNATLRSISGQAVVASTDGSAMLNVTFIVGGQSRVSNYYVLATDYNNYALVYSCANLPNGNRQVGSWQLSRNRTLSPQAYAVMEAVIRDTQGLNQNYYQATSQSDAACFYVPEVNVTQAPLFRGQCEDITGVAGFNAARFVGWWHEIERYPSDQNVGQCISSRYQTSNNVIQVVDTSVFGTFNVSTVTGTVAVSNNGRIRRTLSNNRVQDIWVLATDYDNYALLYSCENVDSEYRRAWSAKHSRTRSLSAAAQQAMAPVIQNNTLLYPQFYLPVNQSDSACFHYPVQTGSRVVLPGQCDQNIPVVQSFNVANFQGTWYQIQRYDAVQNSSCIGTRLAYDATSGNINVLAYEVVGGALSSTEGSARVNSTDGSARLSLVLPVAGSNATSTTILHILATDYENYALAYSCVNINAFERQVGAWQLSRQRTLSAPSVNAINTVIQQRQELHAPYFNTISHQGTCPEPSSAFLARSSIIVILVCALLQLLW